MTMAQNAGHLRCLPIWSLSGNVAFSALSSPPSIFSGCFYEPSFCDRGTENFAKVTARAPGMSTAARMSEKSRMEEEGWDPTLWPQSKQGKKEA
jgi:hypothetical protein